MLVRSEIVDLKKSFLIENIQEFIQIDKVIEHDDLWGEDNFISDLPNKWDLSLVTMIDRRVIGYLIASRKELSVHIHRLAIAQQFQSTGIGKAMIVQLIGKARSISLPVTLKVHRGNLRAIEFYQKLGFEDIGESLGNIEMQFFN